MSTYYTAESFLIHFVASMIKILFREINIIPCMPFIVPIYYGYEV